MLVAIYAAGGFLAGGGIVWWLMSHDHQGAIQLLGRLLTLENLRRVESEAVKLGLDSHPVVQGLIALTPPAQEV